MPRWWHDITGHEYVPEPWLLAWIGPNERLGGSLALPAAISSAALALLWHDSRPFPIICRASFPDRARAGFSSGRTNVNTLKSAAVILVLAGVLYGVYVALNKPETMLPAGLTEKQVDDMQPPAVEIDMAGSGLSSNSAGGISTSLPAPPTTLPASDYKGEVSPATALDVSTPPTGGSAPDLTPAINSSSVTDSPPSTSVPESSSGSSSPAVIAATFRRDMTTAQEQIDAGKFRDALATLTPYYDAADLASEEREQVLAWLDALAAKVIYSQEHLLDRPYQIRGKETLFDIAERHQVPYQLLQNINGISDPRVVVPGTEIKIVPGPMRADVNLATNEITVFAGDLYAGRFPFAVGNEPPQPGDYQVQDKQPDRTYYGADGRTIPANDPANPYGQCWIDLGRQACLHGSPQSAASSTQTLGCISLSPQDAQDVYGILSVGSAVTIRR